MVNPNLQQNGIMVDRAMTLSGRVKLKNVSSSGIPSRTCLFIVSTVYPLPAAAHMTDGNIEHQAARTHINGIREVALLIVEILLKVTTKA